MQPVRLLLGGTPLAEPHRPGPAERELSEVGQESAQPGTIIDCHESAHNRQRTNRSVRLRVNSQGSQVS